MCTLKSRNLSITMITCISVFVLTIRPPTRTTPLSLHDALPISKLPGDQGGQDHDARSGQGGEQAERDERTGRDGLVGRGQEDRKSTRLNSSHVEISYAVFCLKKKTAAGHSGLQSRYLYIYRH